VVPETGRSGADSRFGSRDKPVSLSLAAITTPGLEPVTRGELQRLGLTTGQEEPGLIPFGGALDDLARANLHLRTASRVIMRLGQFHARALGELERKAADLPWDDWIAPGVPLTVKATCRKSRLYHQKAVAERIGLASGRPAAGRAAGGEEVEDEGHASQLVIVRLMRDECTVSLDSSGALLHRRGYRLEGGKAPLRETLAAALLLASEWDPDTPLVDPFCGSGTIPIEAALMARRIPPGLGREFAFFGWKGWKPERWAALCDDARKLIREHPVAIIAGSDRDAGAICAADANADRAGVSADIELRREAVSAIEAPTGRGALVSNPPYGHRIGEVGKLRDLYARLGQVVRERFGGWRVTLLVPVAPIERATGLEFEAVLATRNGGQAVRVVRTAWPAGGSSLVE
jgi:putative N6-adenine-specific DNA methylase